MNTFDTGLVPRPFTLSFPDAANEAAFNHDFRQGALAYFRLIALASLAFFVAISLTGLVAEFSVNREDIQKLLWWALIPAAALASGAFYTRIGAGHPQRVALAFLVVIAAICIGFPRVKGDAEFAMAYGFSYTAFFLFLLFPLSRLAPARALGLAALTFGAYALVVGTMPGFHADTLRSHGALMLGATVLGFAVGYLMEMNLRHAFAARVVVEDRERKLGISEARLRDEIAKSDALLLSMLPHSIARRLKAEGKSIADGIVECTVLFSDLVGFTVLSQQLGPRALVQMLNSLFSGFDALCEKHGLEKIKTIGDAYMVAGGVPDYKVDHAASIADMALDMQGVIADFNRANLTTLDLRIGIHTGPVIAGIIGTRKFAYDLWGDAVNTAARMESHGLPGRIQVNASTAMLLSRTHRLEERGTIEVKGKGPISTFWLLGRLQEGGVPPA